LRRYDLSELLPLADLDERARFDTLADLVAVRAWRGDTATHLLKLAVHGFGDVCQALDVGAALVELAADLQRAQAPLKVSTAALCNWAAVRLQDSAPLRRALLKAQGPEVGGLLEPLFPTGATVGLLLLRRAVCWSVPPFAGAAARYLAPDFRGTLSPTERRAYAAAYWRLGELVRVAKSRPLPGRSDADSARTERVNGYRLSPGAGCSPPAGSGPAPSTTGAHHDRRHRRTNHSAR
jgi:hypothetical protein